MGAREAGTARRIALVVTITIVLSGVFVTGRVIRAHGNPSRFAFAGDRWVDPSKTPPSLYVYKNSFGFDGVGFYRIALDPFTRVRTDNGITFDLPAFRFQRIVYPLLVRAVTAGNPQAVAWGLIAWNLAAMGLLGLLGALLAKTTGRAPIWGLVLALTPAFAVSLGLDTAEIIAGVFLFAGLLFLRRRQYSWAAVAMSLAALTRETTLIVPVAGVLVWFWHRVRQSPRENEPPLWTFLIPGIIQAGWQAVLWRRWGHIPMRQGTAVDVGFPLRGFVRSLRSWIPPTSGLELFHLVLIFAIVVFTYTVIRAIRASAAPPHERLAWALTAAMMPFFQFAIWFHHWGFMRALSEFVILGTLIILSDEKAPAFRLWFWVAVWASICTQLALYP